MGLTKVSTNSLSYARSHPGSINGVHSFLFRPTWPKCSQRGPWTPLDLHAPLGHLLAAGLLALAATHNLTGIALTCYAKPFYSLYTRIKLPKISKCTMNFKDLLMSGDVESNPGPRARVQTYNVRGLNNDHTLSRILNFASELNHFELGVIFLQETHLTDYNSRGLDLKWRGGITLSPGTGAARGCITLYSNGSFDKIIYKMGSPDGRTCWTVADKDTDRYLIMGIYGPNEQHLKFFEEILEKTEDLIAEKMVTKIIIGGDFNIDLTIKHNNKNKDETVALIERFMFKYDLEIVRTNGHTWKRKESKSKIDFLICNSDLGTKGEIKWGVDGSDHALVEGNFCLTEKVKGKGPGVPRIRTEFLKNKQLLIKFRKNVKDTLTQTPQDWSPHMVLEFLKTVIRTEAFECIHTLKEREKSELEVLQEELNKLIKLEENTNNPDLAQDRILQIETQLEVLLEKKAEFLARRARIQWYEKGEKNNKYFLNIIKNNTKKQAINSILVEGEEISDSSRIIQEIRKFYSDLYKKEHTEPFLQETHTIADQNIQISDPITLEELTKAVQGSKGTTPGPDGINIEIYRAIWETAGPIILKAWTHSIEIGELPKSQRESVICLIPKKDKDKRIIGNLRPITLSNCDLKLITKVYTKRLDPILNKIIGIEQSAYLSGRQVHDGLRAIDAIKNKCRNVKNGYLVSLDAKKAFDSLSHSYIRDTIKLYGLGEKFATIFDTLYRNITTKVIINGSLTESIKIGRGVKQGDALSCSLFILCMNNVIHNINENKNITSLMVGSFKCRKVVAYADDIAIVTQNKESIQEIISTYKNFSRQSGLYLNTEKTEILNLKTYTPESLKIDGAKIKLSQSITICGKTFSLCKDTEHKLNVQNKILNVEKALVGWKCRKLTTEGKILVAKTFGISQLIYMMHNTAFSAKDLKEAEKVIFKFIWEGPDKIKRETLKKPFEMGGLKAPDVFKLNGMIKAKQLTRNLQGEHDIKILQDFLWNPLQLDIRVSKTEGYNQAGEEFLRNMTLNAISELKNNESCHTRVHKWHKVNLASLKQQGISNTLDLNPIERCNLKASMKKFLTGNWRDMILAYDHSAAGQREFKPYLDKTPQHIIQWIANANLNETEKERKLRESKITIGLNLFGSHSDLKKAPEMEKLHDPPDGFLNCRTLKHPRERQTLFMTLHNKIYTNERLARFKLIDSAKCNRCNSTTETLTHIIMECPNAIEAWQAAQEVLKMPIPEAARLQGSPDVIINSIAAIVRHKLAVARHERTNLAALRAQIKNRIKDTKFIKHIHNYSKEVKCILKQAITA